MFELEAELGRLKTFTSELNWEELRSSISFPRLKVLTQVIHE